MTLFDEEVEDEGRDKWIVWFDGAYNALGHGVRAVLVSPDEQYITFMARLGFDCTNNIPEYEETSRSLTRLQGWDPSSNRLQGQVAQGIWVSQPTFQREDNARLTGASSMGGKCVESPPTFIRGKRQKNRKGVVYEL